MQIVDEIKLQVFFENIVANSLITIRNYNFFFTIKLIIEL